jgi:hypothetical protein
MFSRGFRTPIAILIAAFCFLPAAQAATPRKPSRVRSLVPGEMLRYRLAYRSGIQSESTSPIYTPESAHHMDVSLNAQLRLDVLSVKTDARRGRLARLRVTYETSHARVQSDAYDPGAEKLEKQYRRLQGRSFEFTLDAEGRVRHIEGLAQIEPDENSRSAMREWLRTLTLPLGLWRPGMKPGRKWTRVVPLAGAPLAGLAWRTRSIYRSDERCPPAPGAPAAIQRQTCAVIETHIETIREKGHGNSTPLAYRRQGLRTAGQWKEKGASRSYVSLATGLVTSSTATETSQMNLTITAALSGSQLHYSGKVEGSSQLTLVAFRLPRPAKPVSGAASQESHLP